MQTQLRAVEANTPVSFNIGPSKHLSWKEMACKDGTPYPDEGRRSRGVILAGVFELIREKCGNKPIIVLSAYRTPGYNRKVGGVPGSQHPLGRALDLRPPNTMDLFPFHSLIVQMARFTAIRGIGYYPKKNFVHIDVRPTEKLAQWSET